MFECVVNISEGRDLDRLRALSNAAGGSLRDLHHDRFHNRSVFTLINADRALSDDVRSLIDAAFNELDLTTHDGVHPRFGVVDVVPFVALENAERPRAMALRDETARWIAERYDVPTFLYGEVDGRLRTLPDVRRLAFRVLEPDFGPARAAERLGAVAVGERPVLVAWNIWLSGATIDEARLLAKSVRRAEVRAIGLAVGDQVQVSCNLVAPLSVGPSVVYDQVEALLGSGARIERCELVGLAPAKLLDLEDRTRWASLGLSEEATIEGRLLAAN